jgi:hypothetical protein
MWLNFSMSFVSDKNSLWYDYSIQFPENYKNIYGYTDEKNIIGKYRENYQGNITSLFSSMNTKKITYKIQRTRKMGRYSLVNSIDKSNVSILQI